MQQQKSGLHKITVEVANDHTLSLLAAFRTLTQCTFLKPPENLSLKALEVLPSLTTLNVCEANVSGIEALPHLKSLVVYKSKVECAHNFQSVTSLLHMDVSSSTVLHFHDRGILACTRLQSLECQVGSILASDPRFSFSMDSDVQIPVGFTDLTALASLSISGRGQPEDTSLEWISKLTSLDFLMTYFPVEEMYLCEGFSALTKLSKIMVSVRPVNDMFEQVPELGLHIEWKALTSLQCAVFRGAIQYTPRFKDLAALSTLKELDVTDIQEDNVTSQDWVMLAHWMGAHRPDVEFAYK